jgi:uncharacterized protein (DUF983 family)
VGAAFGLSFCPRCGVEKLNALPHGLQCLNCGAEYRPAEGSANGKRKR